MNITRPITQAELFRLPLGRHPTLLNRKASKQLMKTPKVNNRKRSNKRGVDPRPYIQFIKKAIGFKVIRH